MARQMKMLHIPALALGLAALAPPHGACGVLLASARTGAEDNILATAPEEAAEANPDLALAEANARAAHAEGAMSEQQLEAALADYRRHFALAEHDNTRLLATAPEEAAVADDSSEPWSNLSHVGFLSRKEPRAELPAGFEPVEVAAARIPEWTASSKKKIEAVKTELEVAEGRVKRLEKVGTDDGADWLDDGAPEKLRRKKYHRRDLKNSRTKVEEKKQLLRETVTTLRDSFAKELTLGAEAEDLIAHLDGIELESVARAYAYLANAYVWVHENEDKNYTLPKEIALPLATVNEKLGRAPIMNYANCVLYNWQFKSGNAKVLNRKEDASSVEHLAQEAHKLRVNDASGLKKLLGQMELINRFTPVPEQKFDAEGNDITENDEEKGFLLMHVILEARGDKMVGAIKAANNLLKGLPARKNGFFSKIYRNDSLPTQEEENALKEEILPHLQIVAKEMGDIAAMLKLMYSVCDQKKFLFGTRGPLRGWATNADKMIYEGVDGEPDHSDLGGPTGAQSSLIPAISNFLGIKFAGCPFAKKAHLTAMENFAPSVAFFRKQMPAAHKAFLEDVAASGAELREHAQLPFFMFGRRDKLQKDFTDAYNKAVGNVTQFRKSHKQLAFNYITKQLMHNELGPRLSPEEALGQTGTGGAGFDGPDGYLQARTAATELHAETAKLHAIKKLRAARALFAQAIKKLRASYQKTASVA